MKESKTTKCNFMSFASFCVSRTRRVEDRTSGDAVECGNCERTGGVRRTGEDGGRTGERVVSGSGVRRTGEEVFLDVGRLAVGLVLGFARMDGCTGEDDR